MPSDRGIVHAAFRADRSCNNRCIPFEFANEVALYKSKLFVIVAYKGLIIFRCWVVLDGAG